MTKRVSARLRAWPTYAVAVYLIDAYNLLHALKEARRGSFPRAFGPARERLLELLGRFARHHNPTAIAFLDGEPGRLEPGEIARPGVRVRFCGRGEQSADRAICAYVEANNAAALTVVSNDREVTTFCRREGAQVESCDSFIRRLGVGPPAATQPPAPDATKRPASGKRRPRATPPDGKPAAGHIGDLEREMLADIGDMDDLERETLRRPPRKD